MILWIYANVFITYRSLFNSGLCSSRKVETLVWRRERMFKSIKSFGTIHTGTKTIVKSGFIEGVCVCVIHIFMWMWVLVHLCVFMWRAEVDVRYFLQSLSIFIFETRSLTEPIAYGFSWAHWPASECQRSTCLSLPSAGIMVLTARPNFLHGCWGSKLRS